MEDTAKLLKRVRVVLRIAQWILLFYVVGSGVRLWFTRTEGKVYRNWTLDQARYPLIRVFTDYADNVPRELALMPPPSDAALLGVWADSVQVRTGKDAGVFLLKNNAVTWVRKPSALVDDAAAFETRLADTTHKGARFPCGSTEGRMMVVKDDPKYEKARVAEIIGAPEQPLRWGILHRRVELWRPLWAHVSQFTEHSPGGGPIDPLAERLNCSVQVGDLKVREKSWSTRPTIRVSLDNDLLFTSPGLDTTMVSKVDWVDGAKVEFYVSAMDNIFAERLGGHGWPWGGFALWLLLLVANELCYRWLRQVGKPLSAPAIPVKD
ncbi:MAG TPA: hypothetical protein VGL38_14510 [bacterium]|jgi:hypothetical protein